MKNNIWSTMLFFAVAALFVACGDSQNNSNGGSNAGAYNLSYAYGAQMAMSLRQSDLTVEEKNADKMIEGIQKGLGKDSMVIDLAQQLINERITSKKPSETTDQANDIAYNLGVLMLGRLPFLDVIEASDFDMQGMRDGYVAGIANDSLKLSREEMDSVLNAYFEPKGKAYSEKMRAKQEAEAAVNIEAGNKFLEENKAKAGVVTTESGLQYEVITEGTGPKPTKESQVKTHYHGTLIDGTVFDSSVDRGEPAVFPVGGVIPGWQEGIPLMSVGSKYRFYIPNNLAYGMQAPSPAIPAGSALIFDVELIEIVQ